MILVAGPFLIYYLILRQNESTPVDPRVVRAAFKKERKKLEARWDSVMLVIAQHSGTLSAERRRLIETDKWGRVGDSFAWELEREEFIEQVLPTLVDISGLPHELRAMLTDIVETAASSTSTLLSVGERAGEAIKPMTGIEFERVNQEALERSGWVVQVTPQSGDHGVDLIGRRKGMNIALQCKRYAKPVGNKAVQEAASGAAFYGCQYAAVVATNGYTKAAKELAGSLGVLLLAPEELASLHMRIASLQSKDP